MCSRAAIFQHPSWTASTAKCAVYPYDPSKHRASSNAEWLVYVFPTNFMETPGRLVAWCLKYVGNEAHTYMCGRGSGVAAPGIAVNWIARPQTPLVADNAHTAMVNAPRYVFPS